MEGGAAGADAVFLAGLALGLAAFFAFFFFPAFFLFLADFFVPAAFFLPAFFNDFFFFLDAFFFFFFFAAFFAFFFAIAISLKVVEQQEPGRTGPDYPTRRGELHAPAC